MDECNYCNGLVQWMSVTTVMGLTRPSIPPEWPGWILKKQEGRTIGHVTLPSWEETRRKDYRSRNTTIVASMLENEEKWKIMEIMAGNIIGKKKKYARLRRKVNYVWNSSKTNSLPAIPGGIDNSC
ncbi:hypothetical protein QE152_g27471 [Popillia japonica]|uniref:Uncharacterized protein n=1 Tax=Popillia japonica TaxID=7064 RepID=A0AAW1JUN6_POPJA